MGYRKRRVIASPNKNAAKVLKGQVARQRLLLENLYPQVERLSIHLRFFSAQGHLLGEKNYSLESKDPVNFAAPCPGQCGDGEMALDEKISEVIQKQEVQSESRGRCSRPLYAATNETCGCELHCRIEVVYR